MKEYTGELEDKLKEICMGDYVLLRAKNRDKAAGFVRKSNDGKVKLSHESIKKGEIYWKSYFSRLTKGDRSLPLYEFEGCKVLSMEEYAGILKEGIGEFNEGDHLFLMAENGDKAAGFVRKSNDGKVKLSYEPLTNKKVYATYYPPMFTLGDMEIQLNDFNRSRVVKADNFWLI